MKYQHIQSLVPDGEHFDESAAINEGMFMSIGHIDAIENALGNAGSVSESIQAQLGEANEQISSLNDSITAAQERETTLQNTVNEHLQTIESLNAQIVELGKKPSGNGHTTKVVVDEKEEESHFPRFDSPEHPANIAAKSRGLK